MEIKIKTIEDILTVRENGGFMEISIKQGKEFCVMFIEKKEAKKIAEKLLSWSDKKLKLSKPVSNGNINGQNNALIC